MNTSQSKTFVQFLGVIGLGLIFGAVTMQQAHAADHHYAVLKPVPALTYTVSDANTIRGGKVDTPNIFLEIVYNQIQTYVSHPGFSIFATGHGSSLQPVHLTHSPASHHLSRCMWQTLAPSQIPGVIAISCSYST